METIKNFVVGALVIFMGLIFSVMVMSAWPVLIGITSFILFITAICLFVILIFYIIVLIGHIARMVVSRK